MLFRILSEANDLTKVYDTQGKLIVITVILMYIIIICPLSRKTCVPRISIKTYTWISRIHNTFDKSNNV